MGGACGTYGRQERCIQIFGGSPDVKKPLGRTRRRWDVIMNLQEVGWGGVDWIDVAQDRDRWRGACEHGNEASSFTKCREVLE
jgi:hypothetical protein